MPDGVFVSGQGVVADDESFRQEVRKALVEADDPSAEFVDHETVRTRWQDRRSAFERAAERGDQRT